MLVSLIILFLFNCYAAIEEISKRSAYPDCIYLGCSCIKDTIRCPFDNSNEGYLTMFPKRRIGKTYSNNMIIDISNNRLEMVPDDRFAGLDVKKIDLSGNLLYKLSADTFRDIIGLKILDLSSNKLKYLASNSFMPIEDSLDSLILSNNYLNEMESARMTNLMVKLKNLKYLDLTKNRLIYLPNFVNTKLSRLNLANNLIETLLDSDTYEELLPKSLIELNLENNRIKLINENSFSNLINLKVLNMESNEISAIAENSFNNLRNLIILNLKRNSLKHIPSRIFYTLDNLEKLDLSSQNQELKIINDYAFDRISNRKPIKLILLNNNSIYKIEDRAFCSKLNKKPYANIKEIDFSINSITKINSCIFRQLSKGFSDPMIINSRQRSQTKIILNKKSNQTNLLDCGCEITRSNKLVDLEGMCKRSDGSSVHLNQYDCGDYSIHSSGFVHKVCQAQSQYECLPPSDESITTKSYLTDSREIFKTFPFNSTHENLTTNGDMLNDGDNYVKLDESDYVNEIKNQTKTNSARNVHILKLLYLFLLFIFEYFLLD